MLNWQEESSPNNYETMAAMKVQGGRLVPRSGPSAIASERAQALKQRIVRLNPLLERVAKPPVVVGRRTLAMPTGGRMRAVQMQAGDVVRMVLVAWRQAESIGSIEPMVQALELASNKLRPLVGALENENYQNEAEEVDAIIAEINRFVAGVKAGRII